MWRDLGAGPYAPFCIDMTLPRLPTPTKDKECKKGYKLTPPVPRRLYVACLSPASQGGVLFCRNSAVFIFCETGVFRLNSATFVSLLTRLEAAAIEYGSELCPLLSTMQGTRLFIICTNNKYLQNIKPWAVLTLAYVPRICRPVLLPQCTH